MPRRTYAEIFLDKLTELSGDEPCLIGNKTLRNELDWDEDRYEWIKAQLVDENRIILGRGKGGSVGLATAARTVIGHLRRNLAKPLCLAAVAKKP